TRAGSSPAHTFATNSMFPAVPQKDFQPSPVRRNRLFSSTASASATTSVPEEASPSRSPRANIAEERSSLSKVNAAPMAGHHAFPSTPDRPSPPVVEQKQNFTPRRGQANQPLFGPPSARSSAPTPPQMQLSRNDIERWQEETSLILDPSSDSPEAQRQSPAPL